MVILLKKTKSLRRLEQLKGSRGGRFSVSADEEFAVELQLAKKLISELSSTKLLSSSVRCLQVRTNHPSPGA